MEPLTFQGQGSISGGHNYSKNPSLKQTNSWQRDEGGSEAWRRTCRSEWERERDRDRQIIAACTESRMVPVLSPRYTWRENWICIVQLIIIFISLDKMECMGWWWGGNCVNFLFPWWGTPSTKTQYPKCNNSLELWNWIRWLQLNPVSRISFRCVNKRFRLALSSSISLSFLSRVLLQAGPSVFLNGLWQSTRIHSIQRRTSFLNEENKNVKGCLLVKVI